jgi:hypothetical protein
LASQGENANADGIHAAQERRYFSCLIDPGCAREGLRRKPRLTVELPGFPILGDGKGDNQKLVLVGGFYTSSLPFFDTFELLTR